MDNNFGTIIVKKIIQKELKKLLTIFRKIFYTKDRNYQPGIFMISYCKFFHKNLNKIKKDFGDCPQNPFFYLTTIL